MRPAIAQGLRKNAVLLMIALLLFTGCTDRSVDARSSDFADYTEKMTFLREYLVCPTEVLDAEYHIQYWDSGTPPVPGPSDWRVVAAIRVDPADIALWLEGMEPAQLEENEQDWWAELPGGVWPVQSPPEYFQRPDQQSYAVLYREDGVLLKYFYTT